VPSRGNDRRTTPTTPHEVSQVGRDGNNATLARCGEPASQCAPRPLWSFLVAFADTVIADTVGQRAAVAADGIERVVCGGGGDRGSTSVGAVSAGECKQQPHKSVRNEHCQNRAVAPAVTLGLCGSCGRFELPQQRAGSTTAELEKVTQCKSLTTQLSVHPTPAYHSSLGSEQKSHDVLEFPSTATTARQIDR
jgi:hypothetical protein